MSVCVRERESNKYTFSQLSHKKALLEQRSISLFSSIVSIEMRPKQQGHSDNEKAALFGKRVSFEGKQAKDGQFWSGGEEKTNSEP